MINDDTPWSQIDAAANASLRAALENFVLQLPSDRSLQVDGRWFYVRDAGITTRWSIQCDDSMLHDGLPKSVGLMVFDSQPAPLLLRLASFGADIPPKRIATLAVAREDFEMAVHEAVYEWFRRTATRMEEPQ